KKLGPHHDWMWAPREETQKKIDLCLAPAAVRGGVTAATTAARTVAAARPAAATVTASTAASAARSTVSRGAGTATAARPAVLLRRTIVLLAAALAHHRRIHLNPSARIAIRCSKLRWRGAARIRRTEALPVTTVSGIPAARGA